MMMQKLWRGWGSPPLVVQITALLVGALVVAQLVTLLLTLVLPPEPPKRYEIGDIAAALRGARTARPLERHLQAGPPDVAARGWLVSPTATAQLAKAVGLPADRIVLGFYTELPVGGMVGAPPPPPRRLPADARPSRRGPLPPIADVTQPTHKTGLQHWTTRPVLAPMAAVDVAAGQDMAPPAPGMPPNQPPPPPNGHAIPGSSFPGGGFPNGARPEGGFPRAAMPLPGRDGRTSRGGVPDITVARDPLTQQPIAVQLGHPAVQTGGNPIDTDRARGGSTRTGDAGSSTSQGQGAPTEPNGADAAMNRRDPDLGPRGDRPIIPPLLTHVVTAPTTTAAIATHGAPVVVTRPAAAAVASRLPEQTGHGVTVRAVGNPAPVAGPLGASATSPTGGRAADRPTVVAATPIRSERALPIVRPATGLFGLAAAPFVEGDFVAAVRTVDGRWAVVSPAEEGFPNAWQRRVLLWFVLSLLAVAPIAWVFARRIVGPLRGFAEAAEMLGRDPSAAILPLEGPAEVGRAAHAFNQMQSRLRSFVDDRTAMIGAISHDLRTPLTRLRFRIEEVPEEQHEGLLGEITAMEAMITSVIAYMRDAATPGVRERRDLAQLVGDVVEDAALIGGDVRTVKAEPAPVDIDALGVRRVLDNLLTNAIKYGGGVARVALHVEDACAVADIVDDGPGIPEAEIERVFEPFYRSEAARASQREGSGLGLAVCRSIARAHGGDVRLFRSPQGFTARVTLPLAYDGERQLAA